MYHLRVPMLLLMLLVLLRCVAAAPSYRYFSPSSSSEQESALPDSEGWLLPELISNPFLGLMGAQRPQRGLTAMNSHHIQKRKCNTATCVTQRLADFLVRSSNTIGTVYVPTNVGSAAYGKRDLLQPPSFLPL
ncbi:calcitonin gene-related peptide 2 [Mugil cephalus]|uniref:calcitonin gene-related peptide 2 n=1 Tax=Mugil cephalus TaxID=48193 RepID=UPI001FB635D6|nr:calcitonin gene-related peptide 2 [Mugil cephalus]